MSILPIVAGQIPAHIRANPNRLQLNANASANIQASFAVLKFKGQQWSMTHRGESMLLQESPGTDRKGQPLPMSPVPHLDVVVCGVTDMISKTWFKEQYVEGSDAAPDCFSLNGQYPDASSKDKQSNACPVCPWNRFGTATVGRGKACRDNRRIAVVPSGDERNDEFGGPMLLRIPPTSLANFDRYARELGKLGADVSEVVTRLSFQKGMSYPIIEFAAVGWVEEEPYKVVKEYAESEQVRRMLEDEVVDVTPTSSTTSSPSPLAQLPPRPQRSAAMQAAQAEIERRRAAKGNGVAAAGTPEPEPSQPPLTPPPDEAPPVQEPEEEPEEEEAPPPPPAAAKVSPFARAQAAAKAALHPQAAPAPAPAPAPKSTPRSKAAAPAPTPAKVIQGVPDDMASVIDGMLGDDDE